MEWLESKLENVCGADNEPLPGRSPHEIGELADHVLDGEAMVEFVREFFGSQKGFSDFIGVGESTVAGWMKNRSFPAYAKRAALAAYLARKHWGDLDAARRDARRPKVVRDGDRYLIVRFDKDSADGCGVIVARDISTERDAFLLASSVRAWELLDETCDVIEVGINNYLVADYAPGWLEPLIEALKRERDRGSFDAVQDLKTGQIRRVSLKGAFFADDVEDSA